MSSNARLQVLLTDLRSRCDVSNSEDLDPKTNPIASGTKIFPARSVFQFGALPGSCSLLFSEIVFLPGRRTPQQIETLALVMFMWMRRSTDCGAQLSLEVIMLPIQRWLWRQCAELLSQNREMVKVDFDGTAAESFGLGYETMSQRVSRSI